MNLSIEGIDLYYEEYGSGIPVVCLHGFYVDSNLMKGCLEPVFEKKDGYNRIYLDLVGMGKTPANKAVENSDKMLHIVKLFIEKQVGQANFILFGESYGGYLSLGLAGYFANRISGLFLLCPCVSAKREIRTLPQKQILVKQEVSITDEEKNQYASFLEMAVIANPATWNRYKNDVVVGVNRADSSFLDTFFEKGYKLSCEEDFAVLEFNNPATVLLGKQDHVVGYTDALQLEPNFPRGTFAVIDGAGHNLQIEKPELFSAFVEDFLGSISSFV